MSDTSTQGTGDGTSGDGTSENDNEVTEPQEVDREAQEAQRAKILEEGRFAATESDDNPIATSDKDFLGTAPEYQEYVDPRFAPMPAESGDEKEIEDRAREHEAALLEQSTTGNNRTGFSNKGLVHPTERKQPSAAIIDQQREALKRSAGSR